MSRARITQKQFHDEFRKARKQFGYDKIRLLSEYKHSHTKLKLSCPAHGEFYQSRAALLKGVFCVACKADALAATKGIRLMFLRLSNTNGSVQLQCLNRSNLIRLNTRKNVRA